MLAKTLGHVVANIVNVIGSFVGATAWSLKKCNTLDNAVYIQKIHTAIVCALFGTMLGMIGNYSVVCGLSPSMVGYARFSSALWLFRACAFSTPQLFTVRN